MKIKTLFAALSFATALPLAAGEGMWMPQQIPLVADDLRKLGLKLDPNQLTDLTGFPMGAVTSLGGCTASFVSPEGLVVTNHHCAYGMVQFNTTPERDLLTNGFLAKTKEEELPAGPGTRIFVTTSIEDVTDRVTAKLPAKITDVDRQLTIEKRRKQLVDECEKEGGVRCNVASFFEGSQFLRIKQMEIRDVRLVHAPAMGVGNYGGETDNWMWPRHTGDYSFIRAYVGPDGKPADYAKTNVPFRPKHHLKISTEGIDEGDLVLVAGYPGRTFRYRTADEVRYSQEFSTPTTIRYARDLNRLLEAESAKSKEVEIRNASRIKGNANLLKNYEGTMEVFRSGSILKQREEREGALAQWMAENPDRSKKYGNVLASIQKINDQARATRERDIVLGWLFRSSPMLGQAGKIYRLSEEKQKKNDLERDAGYQERDWPRIRENIDRTQKSIDSGSDRAGLRYFIVEASKLPANQRIKAIDEALAGTGAAAVDQQIEKFLDQLYAGTKIADLETRRAMLGETTAQLRARNDAMVNFAAALSALEREKEARDRAVEGSMLRVRPQYLAALREMGGGRLYPDANSTLRITFGQVMGYAPRDAVVYDPQTTIEGVVAKNRGEGEFNAPAALIEAAKRPNKIDAYVDEELETIPVNFLSNCDTTGGNSGSPTLNAKGELVGLLFDGNYEALGSDYLVDPKLTRSIHVDAVYMLWVMDAVDKAHNLLEEMGLPVHFR